MLVSSMACVLGLPDFSPQDRLQVCRQCSISVVTNKTIPKKDWQPTFLFQVHLQLLWLSNIFTKTFQVMWQIFILFIYYYFVIICAQALLQATSEMIPLQNLHWLFCRTIVISHHMACWKNSVLPTLLGTDISFYQKAYSCAVQTVVTVLL